MDGCKPLVYGFSHNSSAFHYFNHLPDKVTTTEVYWYHPLAGAYTRPLLCSP